MAGRKSMINMVLEGTIHSTPTISSPFRRKSVLPQILDSSPILSENDDEAERLARRRGISDTSTPVSSVTAKDRRRSSGFGFVVNMSPCQMAERISQCIKLGTENKINPKNAFSLELIDFMTYMIKKKDANMSNLQVASTSLDVSTKIYSFRVDGVHMDILKMAGGLENPDKAGESYGNAQEINTLEDLENNRNKEKQDRKRKRKNKQQMFTTAEALRMNVETDKPSVLSMEVDLQTTDMLYQVMLPNHANSKFYHHPYNDVLVDTTNCTDTNDNGSVCDVPKITDYSHLEICPPMFHFDFQSWNADDEPDEIEVEKHNESRFQFDLDASLPHEDECVSTGRNYFDLEEHEEENVDRFAVVQTEVENIVDLRDVFEKCLTSTVPARVSEYSFIHKNFNIQWAGPSHWKITNFRKAISNSRVIETCRQAPIKRKKEILLCYDTEIINSVESKFVPSQSTKLHARTAKVEWNEELLTLPTDMHYDITKFHNLYLHTTIFKHLEVKDNTNNTSASDEIRNYSYSNENEKNYTMDNDATSEDDGMLGTQIPFTGNNLIAVPKLTCKSTIAYSVRAKKIDMRQLKQCIWKCLKERDLQNIEHAATENSVEQDAENLINGPKNFSYIYKKLPNMLTKSCVDALSFPISFVSLLHLANEKTLTISTSSDMADLIIDQD